MPQDWNEAGVILKKLFIVYGALKVSEHRSKEMIDSTVSVVEAAPLKTCMSCNVFDASNMGEEME